MNRLLHNARSWRTLWRVGGPVVVLLCACSFASAGGLPGKGEKLDPAKLLRFKAQVTSADPFDPSNSNDPKQSAPFKARPGSVVRLTITGETEPGWYTYPLTVATPYQAENRIFSKIRYENTPGLVPLWPVQESEPKLEQDKLLKEYLLKHKHPFVWSQDVLVEENVKPGKHPLRVKISTQVCKDSCIPVEREVKADIEVSDEKPQALSPEVKARLGQPQPAVQVVSVPATTIARAPGGPETPGKAALSPEAYIPQDYQALMDRVAKQIKRTKVATEDEGLLAFLLAGIFWGGVSLITPCVFPMIPITVSFFLKQSEKEHHRPVTMALVYCGTIVLVLTIAAVALLNVFSLLIINPWMNYGLGLLFIFFALSLFGMYDIELPSGLARFTSEREGRGGLVGTVFMALTFTIISFACVAPFLGGFGGTAAATQRPWWHTILGGLAFSATFAAPFFLLALFPTLLRRLPKSGGWLNAVKVVMGFLEVAAALKFLRAAEVLQSSEVSFFTYDLCLALYIALAVLCGLYLLNVYRLPHDTPSDHLSVPRMLVSFLFLGLALYLTPALFTSGAEGERLRPKGTVYAWVDSFLLPEARRVQGDEVWTGNLEYAINQAREHRKRTGQPRHIFVDVTGKS